MHQAFPKDVSGRNASRALIKEFRLQKVRKSLGDPSFRAASGAARRSHAAVAINPKFILLDEPFAGVDPIAVEDIQSDRCDDSKIRNIGIIITDHNVDETLAITDRAYLLYEGKVQNGFAGGAGRRPRSAQTLSGQALRTAPKPDDRPPAAAGCRSAALRFGNRRGSYARVARHAAARIHTTTE